MDEAFFPGDNFVMRVVAPSNWPDYCEMSESRSEQLAHTKGECCGVGTLALL